MSGEEGWRRRSVRSAGNGEQRKRVGGHSRWSATEMG